MSFMDMTHLIYLYGAVKKLNVFLLGEWDNYDRDRGTLKELDNVFEVIYRNSHTVYSGNPEEGKELFLKILMSRNLTPEQRADILMNGTVRM